MTLLSPVNGAGVTGVAVELRAHLATRGEGIVGAALRVEDAAQARALPRELTHGALVELAHAPGA